MTRPGFVQKEHERIKHVQVAVFLVSRKVACRGCCLCVAYKGRELKKKAPNSVGVLPLKRMGLGSLHLLMCPNVHIETQLSLKWLPFHPTIFF